MKKLRLQVEKLCVEPFEVQPSSLAARGTVQGLASHSYSYYDWEACICLPMPGSDYPCE